MIDISDISDEQVQKELETVIDLRNACKAIADEMSIDNDCEDLLAENIDPKQVLVCHLLNISKMARMTRDVLRLKELTDIMLAIYKVLEQN